MKYFVIEDESNNSRLELSEFDNGNEVKEYHMMIHIIHPELCYTDQLLKLHKVYKNFIAKELKAAKPVFKRYFLSDAANQENILSDYIANDSDTCAISIIEQPPLDGSKIAVWIYLQTNVQISYIKEGLFEVTHNNYRHLWAANISSCKDLIDSGFQTLSLLKKYIRYLTEHGYNIAKNCVRTWLFVNNIDLNYAGMAAFRTYGGYLLLGISILWILLSPKGNFRKLLRHPLLKSGLCLLLFIVPTGLFANFGTLEKNEAAKLGMLQIMYNNRVAPLQTFAKDFTRKITKKKQYQNYTCEQVIAGWIFYPEKWQNEPMIYVKNKELRALLDIGEYVPLTDFFNEKEEYRLALLHSKILKENKESPLLKAIAETDEKIQIINMLQQGVMLTVFPYENSGKLQWFSPASELPEDIPDNDKLLIRNVFFLLKSNISKGEIDAFRQTIDKLKIYQYKMGGESVLSESKMEAERLYNKLDITTILYRVNLCLGVILFIFFCIGMISPNSKLTSFLPVLFKVFALLLLCSFLLLCVDMGLRIYISGRLPLSNGYETMIFIAWCILFISLLFHRKFRLIVPFGFLLSGFVLLVSSLGQMNPQITPLMPVLKSPWLSIHVSLIMMSYALFAFIMLNGITAIILNFSKKDNKEYIEQLMLISRIFLYPAVFLLGAGIFIGAIWANVSWGRYWAWDPKEVWALITFLVYGMAFHCRSLPFFRKPLFFHIYMVIAFSSLLMTYFGVNYLLGGLHSYK